MTESSCLTLLSGRTILLLALAAFAVVASIGMWLIGEGPASYGASIAAFLASAAMFVTSLANGLHVHLRARVSKREAAQTEARARAQAQRSSQARTALLGMVSHELRTPLQTMLANVELLAVRSPQDGIVDIIERLMRCIELISGQLDNIAHYTRLANGSMEIRRERFIALDLLRRIVEEHASAAKANHQVITVDAPHGADVTIHGDPIRLHQVINNYLTNAIKYAGPGRISIVVRLLSHQFGDLRVADAVEVIVEDEGPGISAAEGASLWEPFVRGKPVSSSRKGSGLGLAVVELLATSVGWDVGVRSEPGHGATFYVVLPLIGPTLASPPMPPPAAAS